MTSTTDKDKVVKTDQENTEPRDKKKKRKRTKETQVNDPVDAPEPKEHKKKKRKKYIETLAEFVPEKRQPDSEPKKPKKKKEKSLDDTPESPPTATAASGEESANYLAAHSITITSPNPPPPPPFTTFTILTPHISPSLIPSLACFENPTPIQACTWPLALKGADVIGIAETGSGKTLAFGLPALQRSLSSSCTNKIEKAVRILIIAPTRELALQTHDTLSAIGSPLGITSVAVFGGVSKDAQVKALKATNPPPRIIVGTPGRILDLVNDHACDLSKVNYLVLDEADRMLDKGFENDIRAIIGFTKGKGKRQTMMFSATWPEAVRRLADSFLTDAVRVTVGSEELAANSRVEQIVEVFDDANSKDTRLLALLRKLSHPLSGKGGTKKEPKSKLSSVSRILIFALYKKEAARVESMLRSSGYAVGALHGDMNQSARLSALDAFRRGEPGLLVATDVAARGLDIPEVGVVVNYTFPLTVEDWVHRIGRTGRGGRSGKAITYFTGDAHERSLAGEFARVLRESGVECPGLKKFPMTIKKKEHGAYGAFFRNDIPVPTKPTKIVFD